MLAKITATYSSENLECVAVLLYYKIYRRKEFGREGKRMFRIWAKEWKDTHLIKDTVICNDDESMSRTAKVFDAVDKICIEFDLSKPIWLDNNISEFKRMDKTRFGKDNFIDDIEFDYLEIHVIEE